MAYPKQDVPQQLNSIIDKMLASNTFCKHASESGSILLSVASKLMNSPHPKLTHEAKSLIFQNVFNQLEQKHLVSNNNQDPILAETSELFDTNTQEKTLSNDIKSRMFDRVLEAQRDLQLDALTQSNEALAIARSNPDPIIQVAVRFADAPLPVLSTKVKSQIHQQILPSRKAKPKPILVPNFAATLQRLVASVVILLFVGAMLAPSVSANTLPGDLLYPIKRNVEKIALQFTNSDEGRAQLYLQNAQERLSEIRALPINARTNTNLLNDAITSLENAHNISPSMPDNIVFQSDINRTLVELNNILETVSDQLPETLAQDFSTRQMALNNDIIVIVEPIENTITPEPVITEVVTEEASLVAPSETDAPQEETVVIEVVTEEVSPEAPSETEATQEETVVIDVVTEEASTILPVTDTIPITLYVNANASVRVRSAPNTQSDIITQIAPSDSVTQIGVSADGQWIQVELANGLQGWIADFLLVDYPVSAPIADTNSNANANSNANDNSNDNASDNSNDNANANSNGNANANSNGNANDNSNGNANDNSNGNANGNSNGNANDNSNGNANDNSNSNGNANGNSNGNTNNNSNGNANGNSNGNANGNGNGNSS